MDTGFVKWFTPPFHRIATMLARSYIKYETKDSELGHFAERQPKQSGHQTFWYDASFSFSVKFSCNSRPYWNKCNILYSYFMPGHTNLGTWTRILGLRRVVMFWYTPSTIGTGYAIVRDVKSYGFIRKLLNSVLYTLPAVTCQEGKFKHSYTGLFIPWGCLQKVWRTLVRRVDGLYLES
jgi:hypothetical protein